MLPDFGKHIHGQADLVLQQKVGHVDFGVSLVFQNDPADLFEDLPQPFFGIGMILAVFGKSKRRKYIGNGLVGFGLLFLGMQTMESAMSFLQGRKDLFLLFGHNPLLGVLVGTLVTMVVQASSATIGLTIAMASQGLLTLDAAIPILLGDNIGTTITAVIASLGSNRSAKQAAAAHVMFNLIGVFIFVLFLPIFKAAVVLTSSEIARQLANAHTLFNVVNTLLLDRKSVV